MLRRRYLLACSADAALSVKSSAVTAGAAVNPAFGLEKSGNCKLWYDVSGSCGALLENSIVAILGDEARTGVNWGDEFWLDSLRLFGRRYRSGDGFADVVVVGARVGAGVKIVDWGLAAPETTRAVPTKTESSLDPDFWLNAERSEDDEEVVETEAAAG